MGTPYQGTLAGSGQAQLFTVTLANPAALGIVLTDGNTQRRKRGLCLPRHRPDTRQLPVPLHGHGADQTLALDGQPGTYYILVYNNLVTTPGSAYTLLVQGGAFVVTGLTPGEVGNGQAATLLVSGVFPSPTNRLLLIRSSSSPPAAPFTRTSPLYLSPTSLGIGSGGSESANGTMTMSATLPAGTLAGRHLLGRRSPMPEGNTQTLADALTVTAGGTGS